MNRISQKTRIIIFSLAELALIVGFILLIVFGAAWYINLIAFFAVSLFGYFALAMSRKDLRVSFMGSAYSTSIRIMAHNQFIIKHGGMFGLGLLAVKINSFKPPVGYTYDCFKIDDIPIEKLTKIGSKNAHKVILQFHGGGYIIPMIDAYRKLAVRYSKMTDGASVVNVDYKVAPKNKYPSALNDAEKVYNYLIKEGYKAENILIVGDSAGGNLALALTIKLRDTQQHTPCGLICMSPWTDLSGSGESYTTNIYVDPMFGLAKKGDYLTHREFLIKNVCSPYAGDTPLDDKGLSPVFAEYHDFPPMLIQVGGYEILKSDSYTVAEKAKAEGCDVTIAEYRGMFHVFQTMGNFREAKMAWIEVDSWLKTHF